MTTQVHGHTHNNTIIYTHTDRSIQKESKMNREIIEQKERYTDTKTDSSAGENVKG